MIEVLLVLIALLLIGNLILSYLSLKKSGQPNFQPVLTQITGLEKAITNIQTILLEELSRNREEMNRNAKDNREELTKSLESFQQQFKASVSEFNELQRQKFEDLSKDQTQLVQTTEQRLDRMQRVVDEKLQLIQQDNTEKLEKIRQTVEEKLQKTLDERLGQSFKLVSDRLEQVYKGLGEMQTLASGVGDLKKILSNVKTSGSLGEYRLEMILDQILAPEQYQKNVNTKPNSRETVDFAIKIPSKEAENEFVLLPIDSKFPQASYQAVLDAYDKADPNLQTASKNIDKASKASRIIERKLEEVQTIPQAEAAKYLSSSSWNDAN